MKFLLLFRFSSVKNFFVLKIDKVYGEMVFISSEKAFVLATSAHLIILPQSALWSIL